MTAAERACLALSLMAGCFVAIVELHATEVSATLAILILLGLLLGFASRRLFWLWAIIIGGSVPGAYVAAAILHVRPREFPQPEGILTHVGVGAFTVAASMISTAIGAAIARFTSSTA